MNHVQIQTVLTTICIASDTTLLCSAALLARHVMRRSEAAFRHLIVTSALCIVLALPLLSAVVLHMPIRLFQIQIPLRSNQTAPLRIHQSLVSPVLSITTTKVVPAIATAKTMVVTPKSTLLPTVSNPISNIPWLFVLSLIWLVGSTIAAARLIASAFLLNIEDRRSIPVSERITDIASIAARLVKPIRTVAIRQSSTANGINVPITWGLFSPRILLPAHCENWSDSSICAVLMHEMAHVKRNDWIFQMLSHSACVVHWFNPLVWLAAQVGRNESEHATDEVVLRLGISPVQYAQCLLDVVRTIPVQSPSYKTAIAMALPADVNDRIKTILETHPRMHSRRSIRPSFAVVLLCLVALPFANIRVEAQSSVRSSVQSPGPTVQPALAPTQTELVTITEKTTKIPVKSLANGCNVKIINRWKEVDDFNVSDERDDLLIDKIGQKKMLTASDEKHLYQLQMKLIKLADKLRTRTLIISEDPERTLIKKLGSLDNQSDQEQILAAKSDLGKSASEALPELSPEIDKVEKDAFAKAEIAIEEADRKLEAHNRDESLKTDSAISAEVSKEALSKARTGLEAAASDLNRRAKEESSATDCEHKLTVDVLMLVQDALKKAAQTQQ